VDAVFASGSPFPVFSPHRTHLPDGCVVPLVDGGYAHNVPLEAASRSDARQVLLLNASPDLLEDVDETVDPDWRAWLAWTRADRWAGQLVRFGWRLLGFMFARAQEIDRSEASHLVLAALTPRPEEAPWPFLLDFRSSTRRRVIREAEDDISGLRRIGRVESWGPPRFFVRITSQDGRLDHPRGWVSDVWSRLEPVVRHAGSQTDVAFDLDNTILRGDIGDALFLKLIVEMRYRGDLDHFWKLFPNERAATVLRQYWRALHRTPGKYLAPEQWSRDFADYVVLFMRQYERMLALPDGGRRAYPWVVRLMTGMDAEAVRQMSAQLWSEEMNRPAVPVTIRSVKYGEVEVQGGVRVHDQLLNLIRELVAKHARVWIVTASSDIIAQEAARHLGVEAGRVLGMHLAQRGAQLGELEAPVTYREGKANALRQRRAFPAVAFGDSMTDVEMLRAAKLAVVIDRGRIPDTEMRPGTWVVQPFDLLVGREVRD